MLIFFRQNYVYMLQLIERINQLF